MNQPTQTSETATPSVCAVNKSCADRGCGCGPVASDTGRGRGFKAVLLGAACVLGCLAVPVAIGGFAALGGALSGELWVIGAGLGLAAIAAAVLKRRGSGAIC